MGNPSTVSFNVDPSNFVRNQADDRKLSAYAPGHLARRFLRVCLAPILLVERLMGRSGTRAGPVIGLSIILLLGGASANCVRAQGEGPAVLTSVTVSGGATGETRFVLTFDRALPQYSIITNDNERPAIVFSGTVRGQTARVADGASGLVKSISFQQNATVLVMTLTGAATIRISAVPLNARALRLSVTTAARTQKHAAATSSRPLGVHTNRKATEDGFEVVLLKYADVSEVVGLLTSGTSVKPNDSFNPQEPAFGSAGLASGSGVAPSAEQNPGAAPEAFGQTIDENIGIDRRLNAIILRGSLAQIARLKEKIAKLDVPVTSVVLETIFVELSENGAKNVGLDFNNANSQIGVITYTSGSFNTATFLPKAGQISISLQAAIYAQVQNGEGRIISKPRIAAQSGSTAKIVTGDALPILTSIALSGVNAVSQQVQYVNVGVTLQIAPRVTEDGFVTSHIFCVASNVTGVSQGFPTISQRAATTSATVKDGQSFVIGGLTQENKLSTHSKIPLLGDVPLLGRLFNLDKSTESKTDLYIVITPHIVHGSDSSADIAKSAAYSASKSNTQENVVTPILNAADEAACTNAGSAVVIENGNKGCFHFAGAPPASPNTGPPPQN